MAFFLKVSRGFSTSTSLMMRRLGKRSNPGLGHQINAIEDAAEIIQSDPEGFAGLESDLIDVHKSHKQHQLELQHHREKIRQYIIKNKYFRNDPLPNLLTYAEKEQIKFLHSSDNEEWTVERLAESFPANAEIIRKILKADWRPMSEKRVRSHDISVLRNWQRFKNGDYSGKISTEMCEHLKTFLNRDTKDLNILHDTKQTYQQKKWQKPKSNEFSSIITSLRQKNNEVESLTAISHGRPKEKVKELATNSNDNDTYLLGEVRNKKPITIHQLKEKQILIKSDNSEKINGDTAFDQLAAEKLNNTSGTGIINDKNSPAKIFNAIVPDYTEKFSSNEVIISAVDRKRYEMSTTKERIHIPRKLWRKGATYRSSDCYYDDDGEFLYRVPGMTS